MRTLLRVDSSPRPESTSRRLTGDFTEAWQRTHPDGVVLHHDLPAMNLPHLSSVELGAWFVDPTDQVELHGLVLARSGRLIADLLAADDLLIGSPMWNFSIPSNLKAWIDHVVRARRTMGAVHARAVVVTSRGNEYRPGSERQSIDFQEPYLRHILGYLGVPETEFVDADHQGSRWSDGAEVIDRASARMVELATSPVPPAS